MVHMVGLQFICIQPVGVRLLKKGIQRSLQEDFCPDIPTGGIISTGIAGELLKNNV